MNCTNPECGENTVRGEFTEAGLVRRCSVCGLKASDAKPQTTIDTAVVTSQLARVAQATTRKTERVNVIALAKTELASLKREIKRLEKLKAQAAELERLLTAARRTNDRGAVVALRKQG